MTYKKLSNIYKKFIIKKNLFISAYILFLCNNEHQLKNNSLLKVIHSTAKKKSSPFSSTIKQT